MLLHLIEETARHGGHADIIRESLDGATLFPLMAAGSGPTRGRALGARRARRLWAAAVRSRAPAADVVEALLRTGPTLEAWRPIPC
ncbi:hypothetical protein Slala04_77900 [Streptomyces lavendulae subsp. lavendulae]|nr:hypothetical protein Slala04_77900 [Streptomyces lavendulae subsp. lavendulae]